MSSRTSSTTTSWMAPHKARMQLRYVGNGISPRMLICSHDGVAPTGWYKVFQDDPTIGSEVKIKAEVGRAINPGNGLSQPGRGNKVVVRGLYVGGRKDVGDGGG